MAREYGISYMDNDAQVLGSHLHRPQGKHHIVWGAESDANECGIMFLWCSARQELPHLIILAELYGE